MSQTATNGYSIGSDTNNGTSKTTPFITINKAVTTVSAGDTVTINDGTYNETNYLTFDKGATYNPETDYGVTIRGTLSTTFTAQATLTTGTLTFGKLIFDAENADNACLYIDTSATIFSVVLNGTKFINPLQYFVNGTRPSLINFTATDIIASGAAANGGIVFDGLSGGSINIDGFTGTITGLNSQSALVNIKDNDVATAVSTSIKRVTGNVTALTNFGIGIWLRNIPNALVENSTITMNGLYNLDGINIQSDLSIDSSSPVIRGNTINQNGSAGHIIIVGTESTGSTDTHNNRTNNALIYNNTATGSDNSTTVHGIMIGGQSNAFVYGNKVTNTQIAYLGKQDTNSLFSGNEAYQIKALGQAFRCKGSTNTAYVNNSLYMTSGYAGGRGMYADENTDSFSTGIIYRNNNIYSDAAMTSEFVHVSTGSDAIFAGNNYYSTSTFGTWSYQGTTYSSFASWNSGKEPTSLSSDPSFDNVSNSLQPNFSSPLYHAGVYYGDNTKDFGGRNFNNPPTIGAYEIFKPSPGIAEICKDSLPGLITPTIYNAVAVGSRSILLYFTDASDPVDKYVLEYGTTPNNFIYSSVNIGPKGTNKYLVTNLSPGTNYYFHLRAGNGCAVGAWSNEVTSTTLVRSSQKSQKRDSILGKFVEDELNFSQQQKDKLVNKTAEIKKPEKPKNRSILSSIVNYIISFIQYIIKL